MKDITIGITINIKETDIIWNNGIAQNAINLALLFKNSPNNYNVFLVNTSEKNELDYKLEGVDIYPIKDKIQDIDVIFILGSEIYDSNYEVLKKKGAKIVHYSCGTNYIVDMASILFDNGKDKKVYKHFPDEIWMIPQCINSNKYYQEVIYRTEVKEIPFIWSPIFLDYALKEGNINGLYTPSNDPKRISCFEPNIGIIKFSMYNILIVEETYRKRPELIKNFYITNTEKIRTNDLFVDIVKMFDIVKDGKATFEGRFKMPYFLHNYTDVVIAHQWENPLNYAYLEALYLNYPLVHNAYLMKEAGYYYDGFNVKQGTDMLLYALEQHDKNLEEYKEKSKKLIDRFLPTNQQSIETYDKMIDDLFKK